jgi:hypothetical protein
MRRRRASGLSERLGIGLLPISATLLNELQLVASKSGELRKSKPTFRHKACKHVDKDRVAEVVLPIDLARFVVKVIANTPNLGRTGELCNIASTLRRTAARSLSSAASNAACAIFFSPLDQVRLRVSSRVCQCTMPNGRS